MFKLNLHVGSKERERESNKLYNFSTKYHGGHVAILSFRIINLWLQSILAKLKLAQNNDIFSSLPKIFKKFIFSRLSLSLFCL